MKKKPKKTDDVKVVLGRRKPIITPGKIGGVSGSIKLNWGKLGRKRLDEDESLVELGAELKAIREAKGLSIGHMARQLDVAPATIIKFEDRGYPVSVKVVNGLALQLGYQIKLVDSQPTEKKK